MRTILIVEDDALLAGVLHTAFRREWTVELAQSAKEALAAFRESPPDIVLTDKNMPEMDGHELLRELRRLDPTVGVVMMTAYGTVDSARDSIDEGVDAYIEKPFPNLFELVREMDKLRERVLARRRDARTAHGGPLRICIACPDPARRALLRPLVGPGDKIGWCDSVETLARVAQAGECDATVVDCMALGLEPERAVAPLEPERVPCVVICEGLQVPQIARLIDRAVKALVDRPPDDPLFADQVHRAVERIRRGY